MRGLFLLLAACSKDTAWSGPVDVSSALETVADQEDGLNVPQDLAFNPEVEGELWIVNKGDFGVTIVSNAGGPNQTSEHRVDSFAIHFMEQVSSIAFGAPGRFGTCQDSRNTYDHTDQPNDFMGPALWSSDLDLFGYSNPEAVEYLTETYGVPTDLGSHLDMLHESPLCVGIAWEEKNVYWTFDGMDGALVRYDFQKDHGPGYDDHSDGVIGRYVSGELKRVKGSVGHLVFDPSTAEVFAADTGNSRIVALKSDSGRKGRELATTEPGTDHYVVRDAELRVVVDGAAVGLVAPAGLELIEDHLVVTDRATGHVMIFDRAGGLVADLDTGLGADRLAGIIGTSLADLWLLDTKDDRLLRLQQ